jgi:hypothetical protein
MLSDVFRRRYDDPVVAHVVKNDVVNDADDLQLKLHPENLG